MTEAGVFTFTPEEYQVLEDIEFDETIQRAETIRFYTLTEQTTDAFEKLMPKGRSTRFQREQLQREVDRIRDLYESYVLALPDDYTLREPEYAKRFSWISPVFASPARKSYSWDTAWVPIFANLRAPNFYPTLLAALPRPYADTAEGAPLPLTEPTRLVSDAGIDARIALPDYIVPRTQFHEDKTVSILRVPAPGTGDTVRFTGYYLHQRTLPVPNPLEAHPFLKSSDAVFLPTTAPLDDVVPSLDAILTHGVPLTRDPYGEAAPFLKLYDVKLSDIPWRTWKSKFPPVELIQDTEPPAPIEFPKPAQLAPPEKITDIYRTPYEPGLAVRKWLMERVDGGGSVVTLLRSMAIDNGSVQSVPGIDGEPAAYPPTTLEECRLTGKSFPDFTVTGILRRTWDGGKAVLQCVPLEFLRQERARLGYLNRKPWKETTGEEMKTAYLRRLAEVTPPLPAPKKEVAQTRAPVATESIRRIEVLAIQNDPARYAEDKYRDIRTMLQETPVDNNLYRDPAGMFVFCAHSLALLGGDLAADRRAYYDKWCVRVDGDRVCRFCGQVVNQDVYVEQEDYTEDGFRIRSHEAFEQKAFFGDSIQSFTTGLERLRPLFLADNAHDETVLLLLSILQVLPERDKLEPVLKTGRAFVTGQLRQKTGDTLAKFMGIGGMATTALILQTHIPTLIPRRAFGPRPLKLSGYPRDVAEPGEEPTIVDSLLGVVRKTFESFPTSFEGASKQLIRACLTSSADVKRNTTAFLSSKSPLMKEPMVMELLLQSKAYHAQNPIPVEVPQQLLPVLRPPAEFGTITSFPLCPSSRCIWTSGRAPTVTQSTVPLWPGIQSTPLATPVNAAKSVRVEVAAVSTEKIRERRAMGTKLQSRLTLGTSYRTNILLASRVADILRKPIPIRSVDPTASADALRDIAQGFAFESIAAAQSTPESRTKLEELRTKDVALYMLQADYSEQKREVNKLRAGERLTVVSGMAKKSDAERQVVGDLLKLGIAPYIMTNRDRGQFARTAEQLQDRLILEQRQDEEDEARDIGVGLPRGDREDGDPPEAGADFGDYGDREALPAGREYQQPGFGDDVEPPI